LLSGGGANIRHNSTANSDDDEEEDFKKPAATTTTPTNTLADKNKEAEAAEEYKLRLLRFFCSGVRRAEVKMAFKCSSGSTVTVVAIVVALALRLHICLGK